MALSKIIREYGQMMVTKGPKLRKHQKWGHRMAPHQPKMRIIKYEK